MLMQARRQILGLVELYSAHAASQERDASSAEDSDDEPEELWEVVSPEETSPCLHAPASALQLHAIGNVHQQLHTLGAGVLGQGICLTCSGLCQEHATHSFADTCTMCKTSVGHALSCVRNMRHTA